MHASGQEILSNHRPLVGQIVSITAKRRHLSATEQDELSRFVHAQLAGEDPRAVEAFRGLSSIATHLTVTVQRLYERFARRGGKSPPEPSRLENAIHELTRSLPPREALILKLWFESGMTTQKIAMIMSLDADAVRSVIASRTDCVQQSIAPASQPESS